MQGKSINGFELKRLLGKGGMAEVWYAENEIGKPAAVKILNDDLAHNVQIVERFRNEAVVMVKLNHANIRQVYGYGLIDERPSIVMEYLDGSDLKARMKQGQRFTEEELEKWWNQLVSALNYTHKQGIVHRDIKPSNIFVDNDGDVKLLDFGIAKIRESISMTQTGATMGTLIYMSPEQVDDAKHLGPQSDIYSLAVTFVHLLTGKAPYDSTTMSDYKIRKGIVEQPLDLSGVPTVWQGFLLPYLEKNPENRPDLRPFETLATQASSQTIASDDEGTIVNDTPKKQDLPKQEPKKTEPKPATEPKPNDNKPKSKKALWIGLAAAAVAVLVAVLFLSRHNTANGYEYVDLGLPSGTLWATCNVGADKPEDYGDYFAWGETTTKAFFDMSNYKYYNDDNGEFIVTKYCNDSKYGDTDNLTVLLPEDDAATANWGSDWCTPTEEQCEELMEYTTIEFTTQNGVAGCRFIGKNGQSIFLPAAGHLRGSELDITNPGMGYARGGYMSSSLDYDNTSFRYLYFRTDGDCYMRSFDDNRCVGFSIRPVRKK